MKLAAILIPAAAAALALAGCANTMQTKPAPTAPAAAPAAKDTKMAMKDDAPMAVDKNTVMVGGAPMFPSKTIAENASRASNLTTLVAAVQAADLVETLSGPGPFTVFAPTNEAFEKLPAGTVETLLKPENKADLQGVLTYHVVPGSYDAAAIMAQKGGNLSTSYPTAQGGSLAVNAFGEDIYVIDSKGNAARVVQSDVYQSNGVVHVIDAVLLP